MLFSREDVSAFINEHFEPAWEMVRPVPIIRIDFGNGNVVTRTLHGNVASYVCAADGQVIDILPGIYVPATYTRALTQPRDLARTLRNVEAERRLATLRQHHQLKVQELRRIMQPANRQGPNADVGKGRIEFPVERAAIPRDLQQQLNQLQRAIPRPRTPAELAAWQPLLEDTRRNETERRLVIHDRLATETATRPDQIKRWLYRDVLHADLDDPHLGLGDDFFAEFER